MYLRYARRRAGADRLDGAACAVPKVARQPPFAFDVQAPLREFSGGMATDFTRDPHSLLARQLRRAGVTEPLEPALASVLQAVNSAYFDFDHGRQMLERSLDLTSEELLQANAGLRELLTLRSEAEKQLQVLHSRRLEAAGLLAAGVAHDFNNLLTIIRGSCDALSRGDLGGENQLTVVQLIETAVERASSLTQQLLAFGRGQVLKPRDIDLNQTITALEQICRPLVGEQIELRWSLEPKLPAINADPAQIEQVLLNLIVNARDAMPAGGTLELQTARASGTDARAEDPNDGRLVRLSVKDNGSGMSSEVKSRIFEPFFTTKAPGKGTGLGLSTVYGIVRQSGGFITVDSELSLGTTFHIFLPESAGALAPA